MAVLGRTLPGVMDRLMGATGAQQQLAGRPADHPIEGLHASRGFHRAEGGVDRDRHVAQVSFYDVARRHPPATALTAAVAGAAIVGLLASADRDDGRRRW